MNRKYEIGEYQKHNRDNVCSACVNCCFGWALPSSTAILKSLTSFAVECIFCGKLLTSKSHFIFIYFYYRFLSLRKVCCCLSITLTFSTLSHQGMTKDPNGFPSIFPVQFLWVVFLKILEPRPLQLLLSSPCSLALPEDAFCILNLLIVCPEFEF